MVCWCFLAFVDAVIAYLCFEQGGPGLTASVDGQFIEIPCNPIYIALLIGCAVLSVGLVYYDRKDKARLGWGLFVSGFMLIAELLLRVGSLLDGDVHLAFAIALILPSIALCINILALICGGEEPSDLTFSYRE